MNDTIRPNTPGELNRRSFLKTTSTVVGGTLLGSLPIERGAHAAADDTVKVALIGCGGRGSGAADQALSTKGSVRLVAMADAFKDRLQGSLRNLQKQHKERVDVVDDRQFVGLDAYKQAIALADVVILATPPGFRPIHFEEAIRQGKHVFMEKPVAVDGPGVRRVLAAAEEAKKKNLKVGVGLQRHHQAGYIETVKRLHDGAIGDITSMRVYWNGDGVWVRPRKAGQTEMEYQVDNWYYFTWLSGDHICEQHIHNLDVANWVKNGYPVRCHGMGGRQVRTGKEYGEIYDHHAVEYEYADGSRVFSQCRHIRGCWSSVSEYAVGTKGTCDVGAYTIRGQNPWRFGSGGKNPYQQEHDDFFDAIRNNKPFNEAENGAKSSLTAIIGRMATYSGKVIEWDKALNSQVDLMPKIFAWDAPAPVQPNADGYYPVPVPGSPDWVKKII
ncbi:MAG: Gfo/Idh/MocA family oxidoreductase [Verrucomicrobia bacterium]|nr:Gfo/Idh/MocA family oxidoreductase [Verrucomicrobiota bacterium]